MHHFQHANGALHQAVALTPPAVPIDQTRKPRMITRTLVRFAALMFALCATVSHAFALRPDHDGVDL